MAEVDELIEKECQCSGCMSYVAEETKIGFCFGTASELIKEERGCICPLCKVAEVMGLRGEYYCTRGN